MMFTPNPRPVANRDNRFWFFLLALLLVSMACNVSGETPTPEPELTPPLATPRLPELDLPSPDAPPLLFFYVIHTHAAGDWHPYEGPGLNQLDTQAAQNVIATISGIQRVLDRYQVKGTWEVVYGTARGVCQYQGANHIFRQLAEAGHEIAVHAHQTEFIDDAFYALQNDCGITPVTSSGFLLDADRAGPAGAHQAVCDAVQTGVDLGMRVGTENLSPGGGKNPFTELCHEQLGVGNDMWDRTGNLMFPWRPDCASGDICRDDPQGQMVFVDHVSVEWLILPGEEKPPDVVSQAHFDQLRRMFDQALLYLQTEQPSRPAAWGFVTHITEYAVGNQAENPPHPAALLALDQFLTYVDRQRSFGRVVYVTAAEIAELAFPEPNGTLSEP